MILKLYVLGKGQAYFHLGVSLVVCIQHGFHWWVELETVCEGLRFDKRHIHELFEGDRRFQQLFLFIVHLEHVNEIVRVGEEVEFVVFIFVLM